MHSDQLNFNVYDKSFRMYEVEFRDDLKILQQHLIIIDGILGETNRRFGSSTWLSVFKYEVRLQVAMIPSRFKHTLGGILGCCV